MDGNPSKKSGWLLTCSGSLIQASQDKKSLDVGANLFVGNLDPVSELHASCAYEIEQVCCGVERMASEGTPACLGFVDVPWEPCSLGFGGDADEGMLCCAGRGRETTVRYFQRFWRDSHQPQGTVTMLGCVGAGC